MQLNPRYDGPPVLAVTGDDDPPLVPFVRQRRRLAERLASRSVEDWATSSRCDGWTVRDVIAHLVTVNGFWEQSVRAGRSGEPTRILATFDPEAHPPLLVRSLGDISGDEVLDRFVASNESLIGVLEDLAPDEWALTAETPAGHVPISRLVDHGLWDGWIHERDVAIPLGLDLVDEPDEVAVALRYAAVLGPGLMATSGDVAPGTVALVATEPDVALTIDVGPTVAVRSGVDDADVPTLRGRAADLVEALSIRAPLPADAPEAWRDLAGCLAAVFSSG